MNSITIGNKIVEGRKHKGLSQSQLANLAAVTPQAVSKWERGESMPDIVMLAKLCEIFGVDLNFFAEPKCSDENPSDVQDTPVTSSRTWNMGLSNWNGGDFSGIANLSGKFSYANITDCKFCGARIPQTTLKGNNVKRCDFSGSDLSHSTFGGSNFRNNNFSSCNFKHTNWRGCNITDCDVSGADFSGAFASGCSFKNNRFDGTIFYNTEFKHVSFSKTVFESDIANCIFIGCSLARTEFRSLTLTNTFFKNNYSMRRCVFIDCKADRITRSFLQGNGAITTEIELLDEDC